MSHSIMVPVTGQGTVVDKNVATYLPGLMKSPYSFNEVYFYSHGWWTTALTAMVDYSRFSVGFREALIATSIKATGQAPSNSLQLGIHWPAMASEETESVINVFQPLTFFNRAAMADDVGEHGGASLLQLIVQATAAGTKLRFHLIGHSFGCRVVCSSLEALLDQLGRDALKPHQFNLVLLQGACDNNAFEPGNSYKNILDPDKGVPQVRVLVTTSTEDIALNTWYPDAYRLVHLFRMQRSDALGAVGPSAGTPGAGHITRVSVAQGFSPPTNPPLNQSSFVVADLSPVHIARGTGKTLSSGSHSDIYFDEVYRLIIAFLA